MTLRLSATAIAAGKLEIPFAEVHAVHATTRGPLIRLHMAVLLCAMGIGLPALAAASASELSSPLIVMGLVLCSGAAVHSGWRLLSMEERYCVVVETARGPKTLLVSPDHQLVIRTVADIEERLRSSGKLLSTVPLGVG